MYDFREAMMEYPGALMETMEVRWYRTILPHNGLEAFAIIIYYFMGE
jgi:hypothetical protein